MAQKNKTLLLKLFPVKLEESLKKFQDSMGKTQKTINEIQSIFSEKIDYQAIGNIAKRYKTCLKFMKQAEPIQKISEETRQAFRDIQEQGKNVKSGTLNLEELEDLAAQIEVLLRYKEDKELHQLEKEIFVQKYGILKRQIENPRATSDFSLSYERLKSMSSELYSQRLEFKGKADTKLFDKIKEFLETNLREKKKETTTTVKLKISTAAKIDSLSSISENI